MSAGRGALTEAKFHVGPVSAWQQVFRLRPLGVVVGLLARPGTKELRCAMDFEGDVRFQALWV
eukprot:1810708-Heterocapsa_arctica.AAC.1